MMELNLSVPLSYLLIFILVLLAGILGCLIRSCCIWLEKDENKRGKMSSAKAQPGGSSGTSSSSSSVPMSIVVDPASNHVYACPPHPVQGQLTVRQPLCTVPKLHEPVAIHNSEQRYKCSTESNRNITCATVDSHWRSVSLPTSDSTGAAVPSLQRRPKIRRTGGYDDLHTMVSWSNTL